MDWSALNFFTRVIFSTFDICNNKKRHLGRQEHSSFGEFIDELLGQEWSDDSLSLPVDLLALEITKASMALQNTFAICIDSHRDRSDSQCLDISFILL